MANNTTIIKPNVVPIVNNLTWDDATWILTSSFIIFTMQSGMVFLFLVMHHDFCCRPLEDKLPQRKKSVIFQEMTINNHMKVVSPKS